jgi:hypothetical protein
MNKGSAVGNSAVLHGTPTDQLCRVSNHVKVDDTWCPVAATFKVMMLMLHFPRGVHFLMYDISHQVQFIFCIYMTSHPHLRTSFPLNTKYPMTLFPHPVSFLFIIFACFKSDKTQVDKTNLRPTRSLLLLHVVMCSGKRDCFPHNLTNVKCSGYHSCLPRGRIPPYDKLCTSFPPHSHMHFRWQRSHQQFWCAIYNGWVGPRAGLDAGARRKILCPCRGSIFLYNMHKCIV